MHKFDLGALRLSLQPLETIPSTQATVQWSPGGAKPDEVGVRCDVRLHDVEIDVEMRKRAPPTDAANRL